MGSSGTSQSRDTFTRATLRKIKHGDEQQEISSGISSMLPGVRAEGDVMAFGTRGWGWGNKCQKHKKLRAKGLRNSLDSGAERLQISGRLVIAITEMR